MTRIVWAFAGFALAAMLAVPVYFTNRGYSLAIVTPRESARWTSELRYDVQDHYAGGSFALDNYYRCETLMNDAREMVWVVYRANRDRTVLYDQRCW